MKKDWEDEAIECLTAEAKQDRKEGDEWLVVLVVLVVLIGIAVLVARYWPL